MSATTLQQKRHLYTLIAAQLQMDGYSQLAAEVKQSVLDNAAIQPSKQLEDIYSQYAHTSSQSMATAAGSNERLSFDAYNPILATAEAKLDLKAAVPVTRQCVYGAFSDDGALVALGCDNGAVTLYNTPNVIDSDMVSTGGSALVNTYTNHKDDVTCLQFHPDGRFLASSSKDMEVHFYDLTQFGETKPYRVIKDVHPVNTFAFHPSGDYMLVGTDHPIVRLYDVETSRCFATTVEDEQHTAPICKVTYNPEGRLYATGCRLGVVKLWDTVSSRVIKTLDDAFDTAPVSSIQFTSNSDYLLLSGYGDTTKLYDIRAGRVLCQYAGAVQTASLSGACFSIHERFVVAADEPSRGVVLWNSRTQEKTLVESGHTSTIRHVASCDANAVVLTCSQDKTARFWKVTPVLHDQDNATMGSKVGLGSEKGASGQESVAGTSLSDQTQTTPGNADDVTETNPENTAASNNRDATASNEAMDTEKDDTDVTES